MSPRPVTPPEDRFWPKVDTSAGPDGCWPWIAFRNPSGYGKFRADGETRLATRWLWTHLHGPIPDGLYVCHHCDNPPCVNPAHLFLGTPADNTRDMIQKGRLAPPAVGEVSTRSKWSDAEVRALVERVKGGESITAVAVSAGMHPSHLGRIINGRRRRSRTLELRGAA